MNRVDGKVALVTGAAQGIGLRTAQLLAEGGAKVVLTDLNDAKGSDAAKSIPGATYLHHDVTSEEEWIRVIDATVGKFGKLDVLVNNAGIFFYRPLDEMTFEDWRRIMAVNLDGVFLGTKHAIRAMKAAGATGPSRSIINLSSISGIVGSAFTSAYNATKGGVRLFTKGAALECAVLGYNIRVNSVYPGVIETDMGDQVVKEAAALGAFGDEAAVKQRLTENHPIGRLGSADDIAKAILFLASDDSAFMTGSELVVDGGLTAR